MPAKQAYPALKPGERVDLLELSEYYRSKGKEQTPVYKPPKVPMAIVKEDYVPKQTNLKKIEICTKVKPSIIKIVKKKLDLPEKYMKHYDEFCKDKVDILDFGGAFLGDQTILAIT